MPSSPAASPAPSDERVKKQLQQLTLLSHGIRGVQAKINLLREEMSRNGDGTGRTTECGANLMAQYDAMGDELRSLLQEWESGKALVMPSTDPDAMRASQVSESLRSPVPSLGGRTAIDGSPSDALRALNGDDTPRSSLELSSLDSEEVFEAVVAPPRRSTLTREERMVKMKEDRARAASAREKAQAQTHMLRELESVINLRPRGKAKKPAGRVTSL